MLELADQGVITLAGVVEKMAHNPAILYQVKERGFIREGYRADLVLVKPDAQHAVNTEDIVSKCAWSPFEGHAFRWDITHTWSTVMPYTKRASLTSSIWANDWSLSDERGADIPRT